MARRSDHSREQLMDISIAKSLEIIDKNGISGFSARAAAEGIGYTVGTLYHVFGSYDGLMFHVFARVLDEWYAELDAGLKKTKKNTLRYLALSYLAFAQGHYNRWSAMFEYRAKIALPEWYHAKIDRHFRLIEETLLVHTQDPKKNRQTAKVLWASIHGICVLSLGGKLDIVGSDSAEVLIEEFLKSYAFKA
jgi:AcrR family transcriptional regulator